MPLVPLRNIGAGGIIPDQQPYDVELTQFPSGNNVQFTAGRIGKSLGHVSVASLGFAPTHVAGWFVDGANSVILGANNALHRYDGTTTTNVTATAYTGGYSNSPRWQSNQIGTGFLANNGSDRPQYMGPGGARFADLANWPSSLRTTSLRPFSSFLIMAGYSEGGNDYPYTVRWSNEFDPTTVPDSYDITSTTNLAGENILGGRFGRLVDSLPLAGVNIIYAERGAFAMSYIGAPLVFAFRELFDDDGILNLGAACVFNNRHFVVGRNDIYVHDGSAKQSIVEKRVKETFYNSLADTRSVFVVHDPVFGEIWVCYADKNAANTETANRALVWSYANDAFTFRDLPGIRALAIGPGIGGGASGAGSGAAWDSIGVSWDSWSATWSDLGAETEARNTRLFAAGHAAQALFAHNETFGANGANYVAFLESPKIDLDKVLQRPVQNNIQIKRIVPQINGTGQVTIRVGYSASPQAPVVWKTSKNFNIESDWKVDTRVTGRYLALRIESTVVDGFWQLGGFDLDIEEVSER
jgi:hypothetical protein